MTAHVDGLRIVAPALGLAGSLCVLVGALVDQQTPLVIVSAAAVTVIATFLIRRLARRRTHA